MLSIRKFTDDALRRHLAIQSQCEFSYRDQGITLSAHSASNSSRYTVDHTRVMLGHGEETYRAAIAALKSWQQFDLGWVEATPADTPLEQGATVAVVANLLGVFSVNCAKIVDTIDDTQGPNRRFGFSYGTLPDHIEAGEERFLIEWNAANNEVSYDILAYSRPRHVLAKFGYPFVRLLQKRFARESVARMKQPAAIQNKIAVGR